MACAHVLHRVALAVFVSVLKATDAAVDTPYAVLDREKCLSTTPGTVDRSGITLRVARRNWLSAELAAEAFYIVLKEVMNYNVELLDLSTAASTKTWGEEMNKGWYDFEMESWQAGTSATWYLEWVVQKQAVVVDNIGYGGRSGLFTTPAALEKELFADFYLFYKDSALIKDTGYVMYGETIGSDSIKKVLGDSYPYCVYSESLPFCGEAGTEFENYYVPPQCQEKPTDCALALMAWPNYDRAYFEQLTTNHGLKLIHTWASGSGETVVNDFVTAGRETTFYWWVPDPFPTKVNAQRISFPDYTFGCADGDTGDPSGPLECDYADMLLAKMARSELRSSVPEAFAMWQNTQIYKFQIDQMLEWSVNGSTVFQSACRFLRENPSVVERWAPPCIASPSAIPKNGELVFDPYTLKCKVAARFPESPITQKCLDPRPGTVDRSDSIVRVAVRGWASQDLTAWTTGLILKEFLGYNVLMVDASSTPTSNWGPDMDAGAFDVDPESWQADPSGAAYREWVMDKEVVSNPGTIGYTGRSGLFMFPNAVEEDFFASYWRFYTDQSRVDQSNFVRYPGPPDLPDLKTTLGDSFPACNGAWCSTGEFEGYYVPPRCKDDPDKCLLALHIWSNYDQAYFEQLVTNLGMMIIFAYYGPKHNLILADYFDKKEKATMFYLWEPDPFVARLQAVRMSFPDYAYACDSGNTYSADGPVACDYGESDLQKVIRSELKRSAPEGYMFLKNFQLLKGDIDGMLMMSEPAGGPFNTSFDVACEWVKNNEAKIGEVYAPPCISSPKPQSELRIGDQVFDSSTFSCPVVNCEPDQVLEVKGMVSCRTCGPGQVPNDEGTDCKGCFPGFVPDRTTGNCMECPLGHFCPPLNEVADKCERGTYADEPQMLECLMCEKGTYQPEKGKAACESCPSPMTTMIKAARLATDCVCPVNYYKPLNVTDLDGQPWVANSTVCNPCPEGMECKEGSDQSNMPCQGGVLVDMEDRTEAMLTKLYPIPPPKFYSACDWSDGLSCFKCLSETACPGEDVAECAIGTEGVACGRCIDGYYKSDEECKKCNDVESSSVIFPALPIAVAPFIIVGLYLVSRDRLEKWNSPANYLSSALFVVLVYIQTLAAISACYLQQPPAMSGSSSWTTATFELLSTLRPGCTTFGEFQTAFIGELLLPVYALVFFGLVFCCSALIGFCKRKFRMDGDIMTNCYLSLFNTFFIGIAQQTFTLFQCYEHPNGEKSMRSQADVLCNSNQWNDLVAVALVAVIIFCGGFLALNVYVVVVAPKKFVNQRFQIRWKFVFIKYRPSIWWWGLVMLIKGIWLNMPTVVFDTGAAQMIWLEALLVTYFAMSYGLFPWRSFLVGVLDVVQHAFLIFLFGFVPHFIPADEPDVDDRIGYAYAFFSMCPIACGAVIASILVAKRLCPRITYADWNDSAEEVCSTFTQCNDPQVLAKILSQLPWSDIMTINSTRNILKSTYLFDKHPKSLMSKSALLSNSHTTRLQAETGLEDYMGGDYTPKKVGSPREGDNPKENAPEPEAEHQDDVPPVSKVKEFTRDDVLDVLDFPTEQMDGMHVMSDMIGLLTPRFDPVGIPRTPRSQNASPRGNIPSTPREMNTPRQGKADEPIAIDNGQPETPRAETPRAEAEAEGEGKVAEESKPAGDDASKGEPADNAAPPLTPRSGKEEPADDAQNDDATVPLTPRT